MKRYLLFSHAVYYPSGGWGDFRGDFDTLEAAMQWLTEHTTEGDDGRAINDENGEVVDTQRPATTAYVGVWADYLGWRVLDETGDTPCWRNVESREIDRTLTNWMARQGEK